MTDSIDLSFNIKYGGITNLWYDYIKPWWNKDKYTNRLKDNNEFRGYLANVTSNAVLNDFNKLSMTDQLRYLKEKFLEANGTTLAPDSFSKRYETSLQHKLTSDDFTKQFTEEGSAQFFKRLKTIRNARRSVDKNVSRDPFDHQNISAAFSHAAQKPRGPLDSLFYSQINKAILPKINSKLNSQTS